TVSLVAIAAVDGRGTAFIGSAVTPRLGDLTRDAGELTRIALGELPFATPERATTIVAGARNPPTQTNVQIVLPFGAGIDRSVAGDSPLGVAWSPLLVVRRGILAFGLGGGVSGNLRDSSHANGFIGGLVGTALAISAHARLELYAEGGAHDLQWVFQTA